MANVTMPQLGETVTEGTVGKWLKKVGDSVAKYEPLLDVETDKVASEIPSPYAGVLTKIIAEEGATVPVGAPLAEISESGPAQQSGSAQRDDVEVDLGRPDAGARPTPPGNGAPAGDRGRHSPAVRRLAREHNVDLGGLEGSGRGGRVTAEDVLKAAGSGKKVDQGRPLQQPQPKVDQARHLQQEKVEQARPLQVAQQADDEIIKLSPIRKTIAERMAQSRFTIPFAWSMVEIDMTEISRWRDREKAGLKAREGINLTFVPIVVHAVSAALREVSVINSVWAGDHIVVRKHINVGIAVDVDDGLIVPVVRDADKLSLTGLASAIAALVDKARRRKLSMDELSEGTFTVNNTGAIGSVVSVPIINPPQAAIFAMEAIVKRPWVVNDAIAIRSIMNASLCFDHRIFDGGTASRFLQSVKRRLEATPAAL